MSVCCCIWCLACDFHPIASLQQAVRQCAHYSVVQDHWSHWVIFMHFLIAMCNLGAKQFSQDQLNLLTNTAIFALLSTVTPEWAALLLRGKRAAFIQPIDGISLTEAFNELFRHFRRHRFYKLHLNKPTSAKSRNATNGQIKVVQLSQMASANQHVCHRFHLSMRLSVLLGHWLIIS